MKKIYLIPLVIATFGMTACDTMQQSGTKQKVGGVSGAVIGGILGSKVGGGSGQLWATGAGALLGAFLGSEIGASLDNADRAMLGNANRRAQTAPIGQSIDWNNPDTGNYGSVTPTRDGRSAQGNYCREYEQEIIVGGRKETAIGTACQRPDGVWEVVS